MTANKNITKLFELANKPERLIIGLMSGTSLDGLDIALCRVANSGLQTRIKLEAFTTVAYSDDIKNQIRSVFAHKTIEFQNLAILNEWLGDLHANMVLQALKNWQVEPYAVDLIASHGQTVMHAPRSIHRLTTKPNATLQIGDADHIAVRTGIITVADFRQKHLAAGGEGAPLAVYGDFLILSHPLENRILLNLGGIANFTFLPKGQRATDVFVTDTGPGNTLVDAAVRRANPALAFDQDAQIGRRGKVNSALLNALEFDPFFQLSFPKTTGPELFNLAYVDRCQSESGTQAIAHEDLIATLTKFSAKTAAAAMLKAMKQANIAPQDVTIYMSGGGMHNPLLVEWIKELSGCSVDKTTSIGVDGDAKEAVLFAILANETVSGGHIDFGSRQGVPSLTMGKISFPS